MLVKYCTSTGTVPLGVVLKYRYGATTELNCIRIVQCCHCTGIVNCNDNVLYSAVPILFSTVAVLYHCCTASEMYVQVTVKYCANAGTVLYQY